MKTRPAKPPKLALHVQVADRIRNTVLAQHQPGQRLESEPHLARQLGVSVLTLRQALSVLAFEGLIERRHGSGTYLTDYRKQQAVAVATVTYPEMQTSQFQVRLFYMLAELFRRKGYRCRSYVAPLAMPEGWNELTEDVERGRIAGAVFVAMTPESLRVPIPFAAKGVPFVGPGSPQQAVVGVDYSRLMRDGIGHLAARGCRRIAMMQWTENGLNLAPGRSAREALRSILAEHGAPFHEEWVRWAVPPELPGAGWEQFRDIWASRAEKPDGLLVTDDILFRDVAMGILDSRIRVPEQLQVVVHANKGSGLTYPFPVSLLEVDLTDWAEITATLLIRLMNHEPVSPAVQSIQARLIPADAQPAAEPSLDLRAATK